jgi:hypothetical protein
MLRILDFLPAKLVIGLTIGIIVVVIQAAAGGIHALHDIASGATPSPSATFDVPAGCPIYNNLGEIDGYLTYCANHPAPTETSN